MQMGFNRVGNNCGLEFSVNHTVAILKKNLSVEERNSEKKLFIKQHLILANKQKIYRTAWWKFK